MGLMAREGLYVCLIAGYIVSVMSLLAVTGCGRFSSCSRSKPVSAHNFCFIVIVIFFIVIYYKLHAQLQVVFIMLHVKVGQGHLYWYFLFLYSNLLSYWLLWLLSSEDALNFITMYGSGLDWRSPISTRHLSPLATDWTSLLCEKSDFALAVYSLLYQM